MVLNYYRCELSEKLSVLQCLYWFKIRLDPRLEDFKVNGVVQKWTLNCLNEESWSYPRILRIDFQLYSYNQLNICFEWNKHSDNRRLSALGNVLIVPNHWICTLSIFLNMKIYLWLIFFFSLKCIYRKRGGATHLLFTIIFVLHACNASSFKDR